MNIQKGISAKEFETCFESFNPPMEEPKFMVPLTNFLMNHGLLDYIALIIGSVD